MVSPLWLWQQSFLIVALVWVLGTWLFAQEPPAASLAFISEDPVVLQGRILMIGGQFRQAEEWLREQAGATNPTDQRARQELLEILKRTRLEYSLNDEQLLTKVRRSIPNATAQEIQTWVSQSKARKRMIDGFVFYTRREPQNIFLFSPAAQYRRAAAGRSPSSSDWSLVSHLDAIIQQAEQSGQTEVLPTYHRIKHSLTIQPGNPLIKAGSKVRVWLPLAQEYRQQRDVKLVAASPKPTLIAESGKEGSPVGGAPQRTVYFEHVVVDPDEPLSFHETFTYTSHAYYPKLEESLVAPLPSDWNGAYLNQRLPHIAFDPAIARQVATIVGDETNALRKARLIFQWVSANIPWNAEDEYSIIPSFALKAFETRRGDCGLQNTLFITMCRMAGIPARWQSGFQTKPDEWGMHDWAEIYIAPWGWLPADASYGVQPSSDPRIAYFYCGHQDCYRLIINLDWGRQLQPAKDSLRSEPADFQRGEVEVDGHNLYFDQWEYNIERELSYP